MHAFTQTDDGKMWHKVSFKVGEVRFEFRYFILKN